MISALSKHCRLTLNWKPTHTNEQEKIIKVFQTGKEEAHLSPFADNVILHIENLIESTKKLLELRNKFNKVARYKINTQLSILCLDTSNEQPEKEIKETIPFIIASKRIKYLGI